jgi:choline dehydrogenase-like flavoprotein
MNDFDYLIIGSGAGGAAAAYALASAGRRVLALEKGHPLPLDGSTLDFDKVIGEGRFKSREPWRDGKGRTFVPEEYFNLGGKTKWYGAALLRYAPEEFRAEPEFDCLPWPIAYADLEPWYTRVESLLGIRVFDVEPDLVRIRDRLGANGAGWQAQPLPLGLDANITAQPHEAGHFDGFASIAGLKADAERGFLERVSGRDNLQIRCGEEVRQLVADPAASDRVTGVVTASGRIFTADHILLAAGAMHSPRLLQRYVEQTGLGRKLPGARLIGRFYKRHILTAMLSLSPSRKTDLIRKTLVWTSARHPHSSVQPLGFGSDVIASLMPRFVPGPVARAFAERAYGFFLQTEDGSREENRVIDWSQTGNGAKPQLDYDARRTPAAVAEHRALIRGFRAALLKAGMVSFVEPIGLSGTAHACGTLVTGNDPARSVVDAYGRVHGLQNLHVVDASILPRSSRVNPSLTIYAWALRVCDRLLSRSVPS